MRMSQLNQTVALSNRRRNLIVLMSAIDEGLEVEVAIGGWPAEVPEDLQEQVAGIAAATAASELVEVEARLVALGVEIDIPREHYLPEDEIDDGDDEPGGYADGQREAATP